MKKLCLTLALFCLLAPILALPVLAAAGDSFETAIPLIPLVLDVEQWQKDEYDRVYTTFTFTEPGQSVYFVITTESGGRYSTNMTGLNYSREIYDSDFNIVKSDTRLNLNDANSNYFIKITSNMREHRFEPHEIGIQVIDLTSDQTIALSAWWALFAAVGFFIVINFPYKRYILNKYGFNPMGKPLKYSMIAVAVFAAVGATGVFGEINIIPIIVLMMLPGFAIMTIQCIKQCKSPLIIAVNTVLMGGFYAMMAIVAMTLAWLALGLIAILLMLAALGSRRRKKDVYGNTWEE
jgi:hypothetical protein